MATARSADVRSEPSLDPGRSSTTHPHSSRLSPGLVRALYNVALPPLLLAALPAQWSKWRRRGGTVDDVRQRLGYYSREVTGRLAGLEKPWWVHAVSVGEVLVAAKLIRALRAARPTLPLVLSTTTTTGFAVAGRELPADVPVIFNPVDWPPAVRRAFECVRPGRLVLVEAEVWPNCVRCAHQRGLQVTLVNARLSPRSERRYRAARALIAPLHRELDGVAVPEPEDVDRWSALGVRPPVIRVTGSLKHDYDGQPDDPRTPALATMLHSLWHAPLPPILLAASTHPGEETAIARCFLALRPAFPTLKLLVVPRHVERTPEINAQLAALGLDVVRRSGLDPGNAFPHSPDGLIVDTTGELRAWYPLATAVVIGKSFLGRGGQNPVEALMAGRPVVTGPHMENFTPLMRSLRAHGAVIESPDLASLPDHLGDVLASPLRATELATAAHAALAPHQGAARRTAALLLADDW